jgi:hypothetical protein
LGRIVSYADDFVILCASRRQAEESLVLAWPPDPVPHSRVDRYAFLAYNSRTPMGEMEPWETCI